MRLLHAFLPLALLLPAMLAAQPSNIEQTQTEQPYNGRLRQLRIATPRIADEIRIDGALSEAAWRGAALLTGFSQYTPVDGVPADDSTEVRVMYADHAIYIGVRAFEPHGSVIATRADRDKITGDDHVRLLLDTFNDRRRAFYFAVNPFGVQSDGTFLDNSSGGQIDLNPDYLFESRGRLLPDGYEIEIRIPFKSIRYQSATAQEWGLGVIRVVKHSGHEQSWTPANRQNPSFLAQQGTLAGLRNLQRGLVLDVNPVMTAQSVGTPRSATDRTWRYNREDPEFSGNVRWGATQSLTVSGTANPDFSQVEADVAQLIFDPRAAISFPEKRPFFLEGSENFEVPNGLIYTRSIVDPVAAAKMSGQARGFTMGLMSALDDKTVSATGAENPFFNIARLRRDFAAQSTGGLLLTDRRDGNASNTVVGADARIVKGSYRILGQLATSVTRTGLPGEKLEGKALYELNVVKSGRARGFSAVIEGIDPEFRAASGFISRPGIVHANVTPRWSWFPRESRVEAVSFTPIMDLTWLWDRFENAREPDDIKLNSRTTLNWRGGWRTSFFTWTESFKYPAPLYDNYYVERRNAAGVVTDTVKFVGTNRLPNYGTDITIETPQSQNFSAVFNTTAGHDDNFDEWSSAWIWFTSITAEWRPTERARVSMRFVDQQFYRTSDGSLVRRRMIPRLKTEYQVSRPFFIRLVTQYDGSSVDSLRDDSRSEFPILFRNADGTFRRAVARERGGLRSDVLLSYQPNPGTVFFAGYGVSHGAAEFFAPSDMLRTTDGFFIKASYLFRQ
jgi:hypothetical protein